MQSAHRVRVVAGLASALITLLLFQSVTALAERPPQTLHMAQANDAKASHR